MQLNEGVQFGLLHWFGFRGIGPWVYWRFMGSDLGRESRLQFWAAGPRVLLGFKSYTPSPKP